jgi:hypothetical protein
MSESNNRLGEILLSNEELLGPPKVDIIGIAMMLLVALVVGFLSSI